MRVYAHNYILSHPICLWLTRKKRRLKQYLQSGILSTKDCLSARAFFRKKFVVHETQPEMLFSPICQLRLPLFVRGFDSTRRLFAG
jgi:hypothetical protein